MLLRVLFIPPLQFPSVTTVDNDLIAMSALLGGYPYAIYPWDEPVALICSIRGDGQSVLNRCLDDSTIIEGPFLLVGSTDGALISMTDEQLDRYYPMFYYPERFYRRQQDHLLVASKLGSSQAPRILTREAKTPQPDRWLE